MRVGAEVLPLSDKKIARLIGRAVGDFKMIREGDSVAVGLSGGKDSAFLLRSLCELRDRSPARFEVAAITVDPTDGARSTVALREFAESLGVRYKIIPYPIFDILEKSEASSPCSLCANLRRGILASGAAEMGCGALALGHHRDDAVETAFLNLMYEGRFRCFHPNMLMSRSGVRVIRPLVYVPEAAVRERAERMKLPIVNFCCGYESSSMRAYVKALLRHISRKVPDLHNNVLHAIKAARESDGWNDPAR
jgi:tRNA(Ile)-lysidine synthase TilS/MesJ